MEPQADSGTWNYALTVLVAVFDISPIYQNKSFGHTRRTSSTIYPTKASLSARPSTPWVIPPRRCGGQEWPYTLRRSWRAAQAPSMLEWSANLRIVFFWHPSAMSMVHSTHNFPSTITSKPWPLISFLRSSNCFPSASVPSILHHWASTPRTAGTRSGKRPKKLWRLRWTLKSEVGSRVHLPTGVVSEKPLKWADFVSFWGGANLPKPVEPASPAGCIYNLVPLCSWSGPGWCLDAPWRLHCVSGARAVLWQEASFFFCSHKLLYLQSRMLSGGHVQQRCVRWFSTTPTARMYNEVEITLSV